MKLVKVALVVVLVYVGIVAAFESLIGFFQPAGGTTLVITTMGEDGAPHDRVVSKLTSNGHVYVAANHWPRAWYRRAIANPDVEATVNGTKGAYRAVPVTGSEYDRVNDANRLPLVFRFVTGFPPRLLLRLDPRQEPPA